MAANPKWAPGDVSRVGRSALALAVKERGQLEARLPAGLLDGLASDLDAFDGKQSASTRAKEALREATRSQDDLARASVDFLTITRGAIDRARVPSAARAAFGLSLRPRADNVKSVLAALDAFGDGAARYAELTRSSGLLAADLDKLAALRAALSSADAAQEATKLTRKLPTTERKQVQVRIEKAVDTIINAGALAFAHEPATLAHFRALVPTRRAAKKRHPAG